MQYQIEAPLEVIEAQDIVILHVRQNEIQKK